MSLTSLTVRDMTKPPSRYDVTIRVAKQDGHQPDPAAFAVIASQAASSRNASVVSVHTAQEIVCQTGHQQLPSPWPSSPARSRPRAGFVHPAGERPVPAVVRRLEEHRLPELVMAAVAGDPDVSHAAAGGFPGRLADARFPAHLRLTGPQLVAERAALWLVLEQGSGHLNDHVLASCGTSMIMVMCADDQSRCP
jgi:hypothetical protein